MISPARSGRDVSEVRTAKRTSHRETATCRQAGLAPALATLVEEAPLPVQLGGPPNIETSPDNGHATASSCRASAKVRQPPRFDTSRRKLPLAAAGAPSKAFLYRYAQTPR